MLSFVENQLSLRRTYFSAYIQGDGLSSSHLSLIVDIARCCIQQFKTKEDNSGQVMKRKIPTSAPGSRKGGHCLPVVSSARNLELEASRSSTFITAAS